MDSSDVARRVIAVNCGSNESGSGQRLGDFSPIQSPVIDGLTWIGCGDPFGPGYAERRFFVVIELSRWFQTGIAVDALPTCEQYSVAGANAVLAGGGLGTVRKIERDSAIRLRRRS